LLGVFGSVFILAVGPESRYVKLHSPDVAGVRMYTHGRGFMALDHDAERSTGR
jgi:hypothetical protein